MKRQRAGLGRESPRQGIQRWGRSACGFDIRWCRGAGSRGEQQGESSVDHLGCLARWRDLVYTQQKTHRPAQDVRTDGIWQSFHLSIVCRHHRGKKSSTNRDSDSGWIVFLLVRVDFSQLFVLIHKKITNWLPTNKLKQWATFSNQLGQSCQHLNSICITQHVFLKNKSSQMFCLTMRALRWYHHFGFNLPRIMQFSFLIVLLYLTVSQLLCCGPPGNYRRSLLANSDTLTLTCELKC